MIALIQRDMSMGDLAGLVNMAPEYTSAIVNGRVYSPRAVKAISDALNIEENARSLDGE